MQTKTTDSDPKMLKVFEYEAAQREDTSVDSGSRFEVRVIELLHLDVQLQDFYQAHKTHP